MRRFFLTITVLFLMFNFNNAFAQEGYTDDSPEVPNKKIKTPSSDESPFPSINEFAAEQTYVKPTFEVVGVETSLGHDTRPAFQVIIPNTETDDVAKAWEKLMKGYGAKTDEKEAVIEANGAKIKGISSKSINVYAKVQQKVEGSGLTAIFETGKEEFIGDDRQLSTGVEVL